MLGILQNDDTIRLDGCCSCAFIRHPEAEDGEVGGRRGKGGQRDRPERDYMGQIETRHRDTHDRQAGRQTHTNSKKISVFNGHITSNVIHLSGRKRQRDT